MSYKKKVQKYTYTSSLFERFFQNFLNSSKILKVLQDLKALMFQPVKVYPMQRQTLKWWLGYEVYSCK